MTLAAARPPCAPSPRASRAPARSPTRTTCYSQPVSPRRPRPRHESEWVRTCSSKIAYATSGSIRTASRPTHATSRSPTGPLGRLCGFRATTRPRGPFARPPGTELVRCLKPLLPLSKKETIPEQQIVSSQSYRG